ncbi:MAG TPA: tRNA (adenosine(37)-N6)-dimethylallyltransferase MiaA [Patescibacteria group bacterium]|jgi:tRNA dimethylallyltransferase|nr:tRNA (adenosine(37)-N6)-dimethylallyltransferase MiaA [Patescibacteria group bacterium]
MKVKDTLIVVVGPTASGKSELAVKIAKKVDGEIISADSRQIYKGLDIGSGKVPGRWVNIKRGAKNKKVFLYKNIPHYLIDEASPRTQYSVAKFQKNARGTIADIFKRGKTPIICGGTGHWVDAVVFGQALPEVKPDSKLRAKLSHLTTPNLYKLLQNLDPARASEIDSQNPRRLVRALEIVMSTGKPVPKSGDKLKIYQNFDKLQIKWIGLNPGMAVLEKKIKRRLQARFKEGMLQEVETLHKNGLSWKKLESFGLEYKFCALYLQKKISKTEMELLLYTAIRQYSKRQMTWWKRNPNIKWFGDAKKAL